jgi:hypothetical protein
MLNTENKAPTAVSSGPRRPLGIWATAGFGFTAVLASTFLVEFIFFTWRTNHVSDSFFFSKIACRLRFEQAFHLFFKVRSFQSLSIC